MFNFFSNLGKRKLIALVFFVLIIIALPLILIQVQKQQEIRQRAEGLSNVYLELKPTRDGKNAIDTQFVQTLYLQNPLNKDISGVDITLTYNSDNLDVIDFIAENNLSYIIKDTNVPGKVHLVGINSRPTNIIDSVIPLGAFILKAKKEANGAIDFSKVTITATSETQPILPTYNKSGSYEIAEKSDSTIELNKDVNSDKKISKDDVGDLISHYGETGGGFDINNDGIVDGIDYNLLLRSTPTPIPDPLLSISPTPTVVSSPILGRSPTPTPGPIPFTYSIFPKEGLRGTIFTLTIKTPFPLAMDSQLQVVFFLPLEKLIMGIFKTNSDNYADGLYSNIWPFDSSLHKPGEIKVSFQSYLGGKNIYYSDQASFTVTKGDVSETCVPITKNGDSNKKIDIVVVSNNYKNNELNDFKNKVLSKHIDAIFSKDPFSLNKDKFNVWLIKQASSQACSLKNVTECYSIFTNIVYNSCPFFDTIIVVDKNRSRSFADAGSGDRIAYNLGGDPPVTVHEFGHSFAGLGDEYDMSNYDENVFSFSPNCNIFACSEWCSKVSTLERPECTGFTTKQTCENRKYNGISCVWLPSNRCEYPYDAEGKLNFGQSCQRETSCFYGCGRGSNGLKYRSSKNSIMNNHYANDGKEFNAVSKKEIQKVIDSYIK